MDELEYFSEKTTFANSKEQKLSKYDLPTKRWLCKVIQVEGSSLRIRSIDDEDSRRGVSFYNIKRSITIKCGISRHTWRVGDEFYWNFYSERDGVHSNMELIEHSVKCIVNKELRIRQLETERQRILQLLS